MKEVNEYMLIIDRYGYYFNNKSIHGPGVRLETHGLIDDKIVENMLKSLNDAFLAGREHKSEEIRKKLGL